MTKTSRKGRSRSAKSKNADDSDVQKTTRHGSHYGRLRRHVKSHQTLCKHLERPHAKPLMRPKFPLPPTAEAALPRIQLYMPPTVQRIFDIAWEPRGIELRWRSVAGRKHNCPGRPFAHDALEHLQLKTLVDALLAPSLLRFWRPRLWWCRIAILVPARAIWQYLRVGRVWFLMQNALEQVHIEAECVCGRHRLV